MTTVLFFSIFLPESYQASRHSPNRRAQFWVWRWPGTWWQKAPFLWTAIVRGSCAFNAVTWNVWSISWSEIHYILLYCTVCLTPLRMKWMTKMFKRSSSWHRPLLLARSTPGETEPVISSHGQRWPLTLPRLSTMDSTSMNKYVMFSMFDSLLHDWELCVCVCMYNRWAMFVKTWCSS